MKVINVLQDFQIQLGNSVVKTLYGDNFYIMSDSFFQKLKFLIPNSLGIEIPFREIYNQYNGEDLSGRKVLGLRHGGGGDILFMLTAFRELKRKFPSVEIDVAVGNQYIPIVVGEESVKKTLSIPITLNDWNEYNYHFIFENLIENNEKASRYNAYDLFMEQMKIDFEKVSIENKIPRITLFEAEKNIALRKFQFLGSPLKKVGIQVTASSPVRTYPPSKFLPVISHLTENNYEVYLFGSELQSQEIEYLVKQSNSNKVFSIVQPLREAIVIASFMNYFIAPDSMFIHIAGAFQIPLLGIYGPFRSSLRMKYFKNAIALDVESGCSPCFKHGMNPCPKGDPSPCLNLISSEMIIETFDKLVKEIKS